MQEMFQIFLPCFGIAMDGCCWYMFFNWAGCFDQPQEIQTQQNQTQLRQIQEPNPFTHTGLPKDTHMLPAYR